MKKKNIAKIILPILVVIIAFMVVPQLNILILPYLTPIYLAFSSNITIIVIALIVLMVIAILFPYFNSKYEWWSKVGSVVGNKKEKIHTPEEMTEIGISYLKPFGIEDYSLATTGHKMHCAAQKIINPEADAPFGAFLFTTHPVSMSQKNKIHEIPEHEKHFVCIDMKTGFPSYNPDNVTWADAMEFHKEMMLESTPREKTQSLLDKGMGEKLKEGFIKREGEKLAENIVGKPEPKAPEVKE